MIFDWAKYIYNFKLNFFPFCGVKSKSNSINKQYVAFWSNKQSVTTGRINY